MSDSCDWYEEIGSGRCDRCGLPSTAHKGLLMLKKGASPFGSVDDDCYDRLTWSEWRERLVLGEKAREARARLAALSDEEAIELAEWLAAGVSGGR